MLADKSFPLRSKDAYSDRLMKVSYFRRGGLFRLRTGRLATSRISFLASRGDWEPREVVEAEGIAPSAGALGKGHAALAAPIDLWAQRHCAVSLRSAEQFIAVRRFSFLISGLP